MADEVLNQDASSGITPDPAIVTLMLADRAEVNNGKLYIMGGGFDGVLVQSFPATVPFGLAVVVEIPWHHTNETVRLSVFFEDSDGHRLGELNAPIVAGRPPWLPQGAAQYVPIAVPRIDLVVPREGVYVARSVLDDRPGPRLRFHVRPLGAASSAAR